MLASIVNKPNTIVEQQKRIQADTRPVYYRLPRSKLYVNGYYALFAVGMTTTVLGVASMVKGKPTAA